MPQFRYAYNEKEELVDVLELPQAGIELNGSFFCIGCGSPLIAKLKGEKREKHFAHKPNISSICSEETYLHKLAKMVFVKVYLQCIDNDEPFTIELSHPKVCERFSRLFEHSCNVGEITKSYDLTRYYSLVKLEKRDGCFIPDVIIYNATDGTKKVYVEIAVTHFLSDEKQKSDNKIIEIPIETESDIDRIRTKKLTESNARFVNFDRRIATAADAECRCAKTLYYCFYVYKSGKSFLDYGTLGEIEFRYRKLVESIHFARLISAKNREFPFERGVLFMELVKEAHQCGIPIKNCFLCKYAGQNWNSLSDQPIFCKFKKKNCGSNEAAVCEYYRTHPKGENVTKSP